MRSYERAFLAVGLLVSAFCVAYPSWDQTVILTTRIEFVYSQALLSARITPPVTQIDSTPLTRPATRRWFWAPPPEDIITETSHDTSAASMGVRITIHGTRHFVRGTLDTRMLALRIGVTWLLVAALLIGSRMIRPEESHSL